LATRRRICLLERLGDEVARAAPQALLLGRGRQVGRDHQHGQEVVLVELGAHALDQLEAADARHVQIAAHQVEGDAVTCRGAEPLERLVRLVRGRDVAIPRGAQDAREEQRVGRLVVHDQDPGPSHIVFHGQWRPSGSPRALAQANTATIVPGRKRRGGGPHTRWL